MPDYVDKQKFSEQEVKIGKEPWQLPGTLTLPNGNGPYAVVILVHGSGPHDRDETIGPNKPFRDLAHGLAEKGVAFEKIEDLVIDPYDGKINTDYKAVRISIYHHHFERWLRVFKREQILIVDGDNLIVNPLSEIKHIESFLGLDHRITHDNFYFNKTRGFFCTKQGSYEKCLGATKGRRHPETHPSVIKKLTQFFKPHNEKLFKMINRTFSWS